MSAPVAPVAPGAPERLSNGRVVSYALGDVANNLAFMMTSLFFMAYMTDIVGIGAGVAGTIYGVTKIWAGITDLTAGNTVDKANTRWGHLRPWILFGSLPLAISLVLLFSAPAGLSPTGAVVWILLLDAAFQLCYSFVNIPYGSLAAAMAQGAVDRSRLSGLHRGVLTGVVLAMVLAPQFANTKADGIRLQFTITTIILASIAMVLYFVCFKNAREVVPRTGEKATFVSTLKMVGKNKPLLVLCLGALFLLGAMFTMSAVGMDYAKFVLFNASAFIYLMLAQTVGTVLVASQVPRITVQLSKRIGNVIMAGFVVLGCIIIALVPSLAGNRGGLAPTVLAVIGWLIYGAGTGGTNALMFSMQADTVDYGEWKTGTRSEGGSYSILSFIRKCGQGVGGIIGGAIVAAFGYSQVAKLAKTAASKPAQWTGGDADLLNRAQQGIVLATGWVPASLAVLAALVIFFYPLGAEQHRSLVADLNERRAKRAAGKAVDAPALVASGPVVTINEEYGAGAAYVGERVAARLGVPFTGTKFSSADLAQADLAEAADLQSEFSPFLWALAHSDVNANADAVMSANAEADSQLVAQNTRELVAHVAKGGFVLGRDANAVLGGMAGVLDVRLVAPVDSRVQRAVETYGIDQAEAAERQEREDRMRPAMSLRLMKYDQGDAANYDLVIDTGTTSLDDAVDQIVAAYQQRFPAHS